MAAFGLPLISPAMYSSLGYGWANSLLGFVGAALFLPSVLIIWFYGEKMRAKMKSSY
jgi:hypothetical protein